MKRFAKQILPLALAACFSGQVQAVEIDLASATIADLQKAMAAGTLSAEKLVQMSLQRIKTYDDAGPKLNALILVNPKAQAEAKALDEERKRQGARGPMHGIPVILKDNHDTFDMPTTIGWGWRVGLVWV